MTEELRLYSFTNFYLSSIQQGIQTGHAAVELFMRYDPRETFTIEAVQTTEMLYDWAENWKTFICLNGGDSAGVQDMSDFLNDPRNPYPWAPFNESDPALDGVMTTVAVVLPERIFSTASLLRLRDLPASVLSYTYDKLLDEHRFLFNDDDLDKPRLETFTPWEYELMTRLNKYGLAR